MGTRNERSAAGVQWSAPTDATENIHVTAKHNLECIHTAFSVVLKMWSQKSTNDNGIAYPNALLLQRKETRDSSRDGLKRLQVRRAVCLASTLPDDNREGLQYDVPEIT